VGKAVARERVRRRPHRTSAKIFDSKMVGTAQMRLCPPYGLTADFVDLRKSVSSAMRVLGKLRQPYSFDHIGCDDIRLQQIKESNHE
jgi:hypothetical protein